MIETGEELAQAVLRTLGIDGKNVMAVTIGMKPNELATVTIIRALDRVEAGKLATELQRFDLVAKADRIRLPVLDHARRAEQGS